MKCLVLFPHQLYESLDSFKESHVYLVEHPMFFKLYHKVRLAHTRACMKKYWDYLSTTKRQAYIEHKNYKAFITMLQERYQSITIYDPVDKDIEKEAQILGDFLVNFVNYKMLRLLFATFVQKLGYFLFQHLVTLIPHQKMNRNRRKDRASDSQRLSYLAALGSNPSGR